jgi:hypothetical protein
MFNFQQSDEVKYLGLLSKVVQLSKTYSLVRVQAHAKLVFPSSIEMKPVQNRLMSLRIRTSRELLKIQ